MRITGGLKKGHKIYFKKIKGLRPAQDRVRMDVFNILSSLNFNYKKVLDVFAGTGSMGFEALSRGGEFCVFIEKNRTTINFFKT